MNRSKRGHASGTSSISEDLAFFENFAMAESTSHGARRALEIAKGRLSRRLHKPIQSAARKHARQIGEIALAWNLLQDALFVLFWVVATQSRHEEHSKAHAIWHSFQSDKAQRDMLLATARADQRIPKKLLDHIKWVVECTGKLAPFRNDAIHTPVKFAVFQGGKVVPIPQALSGRIQAVERLKALPLAATWRIVRGDILVLANFCGAIYAHVVVTGLAGPWPSRPPLRAIPRKARVSSKKARRRRPAKRQHPPRSFRA
jgi:hypothetical protein